MIKKIYETEKILLKNIKSIETLGTIGNYSEEESKKYKKCKLDKNILNKNRLASEFNIEDMTKKINKDKNHEETVNDN